MGELKYSEEQLNQKDLELKNPFAFNPNIQPPFDVVSDVQYESRYWGLKIVVAYKKQTQMCKCTGIFIDGAKDKKLGKYLVHIVDLTRVNGVWDINTSDIGFDFEVLGKIGDVEKDGIIYRALQCIPAPWS